MPARIALGHVAAWEYPLDALLMLAAIRVTAARARGSTPARSCAAARA